MINFVKKKRDMNNEKKNANKVNEEVDLALIDFLAEELSEFPKTKLAFKVTCNTLDCIKYILKENNMSIEQLSYQFIFDDFKKNPIL